ncbi:MAG TPA: UDP binding domain-containing protein, partial [Rhodocyclaceae bacterium]|nr:UDP binding domain-containing protein [Rhodocyclaceae bacterium]
GAKVTVLGLTFKENCPDVRNSKVPDIVRELESYGVEVTVCDPVADAAEAAHEYGLTPVAQASLQPADAVVVAVGHREFAGMAPAAMAAFAKPGGAVVDVKSVLDSQAYAAAGYSFWRL